MAEKNFPPRVWVYFNKETMKPHHVTRSNTWIPPAGSAANIGLRFISLREAEAIAEERERRARAEAIAIVAKEFDAWLDLIEMDHRDILDKGLYKDPEESSYHYRNRVNLLRAVMASINRALLKCDFSAPNGYETQESGLNATREGTRGPGAVDAGKAGERCACTVKTAKPGNWHNPQCPLWTVPERGEEGK